MIEIENNVRRATKVDRLDVRKEDSKLMMGACKELFLNAHPEMIGMKLSKKFMFRKLVEFYLNN